MKKFKVFANNITIDCRSMGEGPLLILIGGFRFTMDLWDKKLTEFLSRNFKVVQYDLRGVAATTDDKRLHSMDLYADDLIALTRSFQEKAILFGWSMGSYIAQEAAIKEPDLFSHIILSCSNCGGNEMITASDEVYKLLSSQADSPEEAAQRLFQLLFPSKWFDDNKWIYQAFPRPQSFCSEETAQKQDAAITEWAGTYSRLHALKMPVIIINGTDDLINPKGNGQILKDQIHSSELIQISNGGHGILYQFPEKVANFVASLIEYSNNRKM